MHKKTISIPECSAHRFNVSARFAENETTISRTSKSMPPGGALTIQAAKLDAITTILYGPGLDALQSMEGSIQESVLWLIADLAGEIHALAQLNEQHVDVLSRMTLENGND